MANKLAGLAALAALGYGANKFFNKDKTSSTSTTQETAAPAEVTGVEGGDQYLGQPTGVEGGDQYIPPKKNSTGTSTRTSAKEKTSTQTDARDREAGTSRGTRVVTPNPRDLEAKMSRGRRAPVEQNDSGYTGQGGSGRGGQGGPTAAELARYVQPPSSAQTQAGLEMMGGGPGLKALSTMAKGMANTKRAAPYVQELANNPTRQLAYDKAGAVNRAREARASSRQEEMLRENARRSGLDPDNINPTVAQKVRENLGGSEFSLGMKRGGAVKKMAKGGMTSSPMSNASRRADGIASKGKTRGKIY
jgi:hypothetical protein